MGFSRMNVGEEDTPIGAMPGCFRLGWRHGLIDEVSESWSRSFWMKYI